MRTEIVASESLSMDTLTLMDFLNEHVGNNYELAVVYVTDDTGRIFDRVSLVKEVLSDGSKVFNLVLSSQ